MEENSHSIYSMLRENIVEHLLIGDLLRTLWRRSIFDVEVLRSEFDAGGYDLVVSHRNFVRHIQLKTLREGGKADEFKVGTKLAARPSGCAVCVIVSDNLELNGFLWFGGSPGEPLPSIEHMKIARHTKGNSSGDKLERALHRLVPRKDFVKLATIEHLVDRLVGGLDKDLC